jgi:hypothetical protein
MNIVSNIKRAVINFAVKHDMWVVILFVLVCGGLFFWGVSSVISTAWTATTATENPIERGFKWVALAIVFHAIWNKHQVTVEASK